jgi:hypothetical protein
MNGRQAAKLRRLSRKAAEEYLTRLAADEVQAMAMLRKGRAKLDQLSHRIYCESKRTWSKLSHKDRKRFKVRIR